MNLILVLRAEIVCLVMLLYLTLVSGSFRIGKDSGVFSRILLFAIIHTAMDLVTVWTVNHTETVPLWLNNFAHLIFYFSAILYSYEMCIYTMNLTRPRQMDLRTRLLALIPVAVYLILLCTPLMTIEYEQLNGTKASVGTAPIIGYVIAFGYFIAAIGSIVVHWNKVGRHYKRIMLPMLLLLILSELIQTQVKEFLFTGCAITVITVTFFFTLENPATALERKIMQDALSGLGTRLSYEHDIAEYDREFEQNRTMRYTFVFVDINNLRSVNGMYGHQEGDDYITDVAIQLITNLRGADHIYRMGGDDFLAIYRKTGESVVIKDIKRVQEACKKHRRRYNYLPELAIGYAISDPKYNSLRDVLRVADYMMYRNKADIKRVIAEDAIHHTGTRLNLTGLTDRVFDAMCLVSEEYYPYLTNLETYVTRIAPAMAEYFGLENEFLDDFAGIWNKLVHPDDLQEYTSDISATLSGRKQYHFCRYRVRNRNGEYVQVTCRGGVYHGHDGEPDVFAGYIVNHGASGTVDTVTGLKNHSILFERLEPIMEKKTRAMVIRLEIRNHNRIRTLYGTETAGTLTRSLADSLEKAVEGEGEVFSSHGSGFVILLPEQDAQKANEVFNRIRKMCITGIQADEELIPVSIAGGAVSLPDDTLKTPTMVRQAALFASEEATYGNHGRLVFFSETASGSGGEGRELLKIIQHDCVMDRTRFYLRFQPIIRAQSGELAGAEALLRWRSEEQGEVSPARFIGFLENDPAYEPLGYDIIRQAVRVAGRIRRTNSEFRINVNITAIQLLDEDFIGNVKSILEEEKFEPSALILELTERCKEMEFSLLEERVEELRKTGIRVALDDMGTGYSTIDLLLHLPTNEIKLDMYFTRELQGTEKHEMLTRTLCAAAARSSVDICFEGVETKEMLEYLKGYGDVLVQGYYFDKPLLAEEFEQKYCGNPANS